MTRLTVFYDAGCGFCCAVRSWVARQAQLIPVEWRPRAQRDEDELVVVSDTGEVWSGDTAWLMVLWALSDYRSWAYRLASPVLLPTVRAMFARISKYRGSLSCALGLRPEAE